MKMFEEELRIDIGIILLSRELLIGHVESVVCLGVIRIVFDRVSASLYALLILFELGVT